MMTKMTGGLVAACAALASTVLAASAPFEGQRLFRVRDGWHMASGEAAAAIGGTRVSKADFDDSKWLPAKVPGTVLGNLVDNKVLPDPYWGLNNRREAGIIPDVSVAGREYYTAWFRTTFELPEDVAKGEFVWMRPEGINYRSEIWLNGRLAACTAGMFARTPINVTSFVNRKGGNVLAVKVFPVDHPGRFGTKKGWGAPGEWRNGGDGEIGRNVSMMMTAGWDFTFNDGIRDRNTGIWKDITFFATGTIRLDAPFVKTRLNADLTEAELELSIDVANATDIGCNSEAEVTAEIEGTDIRFSRKIELRSGESRVERFTAKIRNPRLWWPRNKGPQNLYTAKFTARGGLYDIWTFENRGEKKVSPYGARHEVACRFGIREAYSDQSGPDGARQFWINGRRIFIRGTNWIPEAMLKSDDARMAAELRLTADSGVNLLRLWAGGIAESDYFYQLCDEYGLLVWQEFWMSGDGRQPDDKQLYLSNVEDTVKRIRMHPSLCHYVASNESSDVAGQKELLERLDGTRSYMRQSECDGVHDGSPYFPLNPMSYYEDTASPRGSRVCGFNPEYGTCALPPAECCRAFMPEELLWPVEKNIAAWKYREGGGFDRMTEFHHQHVNGYGASRTFDEYARKSQAADALAHRALWETWNRARTRATGLLFWYNNTPIPQLGGHAWDYSLVATASFFAQRNALEPLHAQYEYLSNRVSIASDVYGVRTLAVKAEVFDFDSRKVWERTASADVPGETNVDLFAIPFGTELKFDKPHFIRLGLLENGREIASTFYWRSNSRYEGPKTATGPCVVGFEELENLPKTTLAAREISHADGKLAIEIENTGDRIAFMVEARLEGVDGKYLRPVFFTDNFLSLLPHEKRTIEAEHPQGLAKWSVKAWNSP